MPHVIIINAESRAWDMSHVREGDQLMLRRELHALQACSKAQGLAPFMLGPVGCMQITLFEFEKRKTLLSSLNGPIKGHWTKDEDKVVVLDRIRNPHF